MAESNIEKRKRGRPPGSISKQTVTPDPGDNSKYLLHNMQLSEMASHEIDVTNEVEVKARIADYFALCAENDMRPSVSGFALAFDVDRATIWRWAVGDVKYIPEKVRKQLKRAYAILNAQTEDFMQNGKINPVAGIFLMKNNFGYKDERDVIVTPVNPLGEETDAEELRRKYLNAIEAESPEYKQLTE